MALALRDPNTIWLSTDPSPTLWDSATDHAYKAAVAPITPGSMVQLVDTAGDLTWVLHPDGTAQQGEFFVAVERTFTNADTTDGLAIEEPYAIGDTVAVMAVRTGDTFLARIDNGIDVPLATRLSIAASGFMIPAAATTPAANTAFFKSLIDTGGAVGAPTHIRVFRFH